MANVYGSSGWPFLNCTFIDLCYVHSNHRYNCMYYTLSVGHCFNLKMSNISSYLYLIEPDEIHYYHEMWMLSR